VPKSTSNSAAERRSGTKVGAQDEQVESATQTVALRQGLEDWLDKVIVPALSREYRAEIRAGESVPYQPSEDKVACRTGSAKRGDEP